MKIAVISDIHGNYKALEAFLEFIQSYKIESILCLGDYITDSPYPKRTLELIYQMMDKYDCHMIRGNREEYLLRHEKHPQGWKPSSSNGALYYTYQHITKEDLRFFDQLPITREVFIGNCPTLTLCHGAPEETSGHFAFDLEFKDQFAQNTPVQNPTELL